MPSASGSALRKAQAVRGNAQRAIKFKADGLTVLGQIYNIHRTHMNHCITKARHQGEGVLGCQIHPSAGGRQSND